MFVIKYKGIGNVNIVVETLQVQLQTPMITLGQLLKWQDVIEHGGQAKQFLQENTVLVNDTHETRRGRKLFPGDRVTVLGKVFHLTHESWTHPTTPI